MTKLLKYLTARQDMYYANINSQIIQNMPYINLYFLKNNNTILFPIIIRDDMIINISKISYNIERDFNINGKEIEFEIAHRDIEIELYAHKHIVHIFGDANTIVKNRMYLLETDWIRYDPQTFMPCRGAYLALI